MVKALKTQSVEPVMVMILSGQEPSEMLTRALLCGDGGQSLVNANQRAVCCCLQNTIIGFLAGSQAKRRRSTALIFPFVNAELLELAWNNGLNHAVNSWPGSTQMSAGHVISGQTAGSQRGSVCGGGGHRREGMTECHE